MNLNELNGDRQSVLPKQGKDWWSFNKGMKDYLMVYRGKKRRDKPKTNGIANNTTVAPHSAQRIGVTTRP